MVNIDETEYDWIKRKPDSFDALGIRSAAAFDESQHPRDEKGKFSDEIGDGSITHPLAVIGDLPVSQKAFGDYLKKHGQEWKAGPVPKGTPKGKKHECYANASRLVMNNDDLSYVEGLAYVKGLPGAIGILHAWAVDKKGNVIDNTLPNPEKNRYFGVKYPTDKYIAHIVRTRVFGVFGGLTKDAQKILKKGGL